MDKIINRGYYLKKLIDRQNNKLIKIVTGIRRCGKSYLLNEIFIKYLLEHGVKKDHIISIALDNIEDDELLNPKNLSKHIKNKIIDNEIYYIILDEIQLVDKFEFLLNGLLRIQNVDIYVTGSNSKFLSSDIITEFRGRGDEIRVYPLSFSEYYSVKKNDDNMNNLWRDYCIYGGLPLIALQKNNEMKMDYLKTQTQNIYLNDIIERNRIHDKSNLNSLVNIISSSIGSLTNPKKIADTFNTKLNLGISNKTVSLYLEYLENAFLVEKSVRFDIKGRRYIGTPMKYYFTDIGVRNSLLNFRQDEESHIMENVIYIELRRRGFNVDVGVVEIRDKENDKKQLEIDFIANKGNNKYYIQSALTVSFEDKRIQEQRPLLNVNDFFKKFIIVKDNIKKGRNESGIIKMDIFDFLLDINSLDY